MDELLKNLSLMPAWAQALLAMLALLPLYRLARATIFKPPVARRTEREYAAWCKELVPLGWKGRIERGLSAKDIDLNFKEGGSGRGSFNLLGESGWGDFTLHGMTSEMLLSLDLNEASRVGACDALRVPRKSTRLLMRLDPEAEAALTALSGCFTLECWKELELRWGLQVSWKLPMEAWDEESARALTDHGAFIGHMMTLEDALLRDEEIATPDAPELLAIAEEGSEVRSVLAKRALMVLHAGSPQAEDITRRLLSGGAEDRALALGWSLDEEALGVLNATDEKRLSARVDAIVRADVEMGLELARHARRVHLIEELVREAHVRFGEESSTPPDLRRRDGHYFALFLLGSFRGDADARDFAVAYSELIEYVEWSYQRSLSFSEVMGDLNAWHEDFVSCALGTAARDDVYTFWSHALGAVWRPSLAARLLEVVASEAIGAEGLCAILEESVTQEDVRMLAPGRLAASRVSDHWSTDEVDMVMVREHLKALEKVLAGAKRDGGQLTLSVGEGGGISMSTPSESGGLEEVEESPRPAKTSRGH